METVHDEGVSTSDDVIGDRDGLDSAVSSAAQTKDAGGPVKTTQSSQLSHHSMQTVAEASQRSVALTTNHLPSNRWSRDNILSSLSRCKVSFES